METWGDLSEQKCICCIQFIHNLRNDERLFQFKS
jgi:hypothetical protein